MAFTFKDFKAALKKHHSLTIHKTGKNFVWVEYDGVIPTDKCHYEINADEQSKANHDGSHLFVEIHFEGPNWERFVKCIENIDGLRIFPWLKDYKAFRLLTDNGFDMDGSDSIVDAIKYVDERLETLHKKIGITIKQTIKDIKMEDEIKDEIKKYKDLLENKKNIILQGAPGVGKTYKTAALALSICGVKDDIFNDHKKIMEHYNKMRFNEKTNPDGQIGFVTFHQSMDYEDFVEGTKPKIIDDDKMIYKVEDGIFKLICKSAANPHQVKQTKSLDLAFEDLLQDIMDGKVKNLKLKNGNSTTELSVSAQRAIKWKSGNGEFDINCVSKERLLKLCETYDTKKKIEEISNITEAVRNAIGGCNTSYYWAVANYLLSKIGNEETSQDKPIPHVLIIDEINRGNVSKIFGELITLLEADKRIDGDHPIKVTLPYSKEEFGVPSNLYIIGTMNTTDRSVGNIDYAVRRRFAFVTLKSKKDVVAAQIPKNQQAENLFDAVEAFIKKNQIEMDFEDLMVGHSYFIAKDEAELEMKWKYEIIPLLHEYYKDGLLQKDVLSETTVDDFISKWKKQSS
ncbi:MAG: AAA family ATPase [Bacteroidales bacterium]|nr:AAA family ATPase [Bacteroidales bacterium]